MQSSIKTTMIIVIKFHLPKKYAYLWNKIISAPRTELLKSKENKSVEKQDNISGW